MSEEPRLSAQDIIEGIEPALSPARRMRALVALLAGLGGAVFLTTLWWTEPAPLPDRTRLAFGLFTVVCLAWAGFGAWTLTRRAPLFATQRVVAAWIGVVASTASAVVAMAVATQRGVGTGVALTAGGLFVASALVLAVRAHLRRAALVRRMRELTGGEGG
ncbi:transmembrane transport protein [Streptomyces sparsus]